MPNVGLAVRYTMRAFTRGLTAPTAAIDLTPAEFRLLRTLAEEGGSTPTELAGLAAMDRPYVSALIKKLAGRGLVDVAADERDRRRSLVTMTADGVRVFARLVDETERINAVALDGLSAAEVTTLMSVLERMRWNLAQHAATVT